MAILLSYLKGEVYTEHSNSLYVQVTTNYISIGEYYYFFLEEKTYV